MKQMNGLDRMFINVESPRLPMDVVGIFVLDPSTAPGRHDYQRVRAELSDRLPRIPVFTRRPIMAPFAAGHEHWVVDPNFSIDHHLKHLGVPAPYDLSALCDLAMTVFDEPLDRSRPLWEMYYVDGLADGSAALLMRMHHATIDGVGGVEMLGQLLDTKPLPAPPETTRPAVDGERVPSQVEMLLRSVPDQVLMPARLAYRGVLTALPFVRKLVAPSTTPSPRPARPDTQAPAESISPPGTFATPAASSTSRILFNRYVNDPQRSLAVASLPMADVLAAKKRFGVTLNDVVLAVTSAAVADYLRDRGELPDEPLRVASPINVRDKSATSDAGNHFVFMIVAITSEVSDPVKRLMAISAMTKKRKPARVDNAPPNVGSAREGTSAPSRKPAGSALGDVMRLIDNVPSGALLAIGQVVNSPAIRAMPPVANYVVSNIPGPRQKLYLAGAEITHLYGRSIVGAGIGLFIHCISFGDTLDFGITALGELVPEPEEIAEAIPRHLALLLDAAAHHDEDGNTESGGAGNPPAVTTVRGKAKPIRNGRRDAVETSR
jgi:WS/DGAT/MGAT family acyltransferase